MNVGVVSSVGTDKSKEILVDWFTTKERTSERRCSSSGKLFLRIKAAAVAGYYHPESLSVLESQKVISQATLPKLEDFSVGDRVLVDPEVNPSVQKEVSTYYERY